MLAVFARLEPALRTSITFTPFETRCVARNGQAPAMCALTLAHDNRQPGRAPTRQAVFQSARVETAKAQLRYRFIRKVA